jgi:hypothetical protein
VAAPPAALVIAGAARARPELRELLGADRVTHVERLLLGRATAWAEEVSGGRVFTAGHDEGVADAVARLLVDVEGGPVLVVWPVLPRWRPDHAAAVLDDLAAGCEVSLAPVFDRGLYLLGLARLIPELLNLPAEAWDSPDATGLVLAPLNQAQVPVGLVRPERALRRATDVRAAVADPLLDSELRLLLEG